MKKLFLLLFLSQRLFAQNSQHPDTAVKHEFIINNFKTESGVVLPQAHIIYGTYGHLNAKHDNVILLPSHYMADYHGYEWLIGPGKALDTSKLFLVATELFGNGRSSSPSNTPEPYHAPRFPIMTIRDNVEAVHQLLTQELKITHLRALVGFSMGATFPGEIRPRGCRTLVLGNLERSERRLLAGHAAGILSAARSHCCGREARTSDGAAGRIKIFAMLIISDRRIA